MSAKIFASLGKGISYPFKHLGQWLLLTIVFIAAAAAVAGAVTSLAAGNAALGIILFVVSILIDLFIYGTAVKLYGRKEKIFSLLGNVGRGFQLLVITLIYQIITVIVTIIASIAGGAALVGLDKLATITAGPDAIWGIIAGFGLWAVLILILAIFFSIFMMPAVVNFAVQGKFGAAFHFKEIFAMIGQAKWYKILLGILVLFVATIILCVIIGLIVGLLSLIPVAGTIIGAVIGLILVVGLFFVATVFWAEMFNPENQ
ncbi:MAG: DUF4013 domain-containing protein [Methanocorpusculum sp.]|nr:DUF4013 domain-containing protein [Methanocorpusculum sp.]